MHSTLFTLTAHPDITKFELEDGMLRGAVASLLAERSSISEVTVDIPRDGTENLPHDFPSTPDSTLIAITASSVSDTAQALDLLVNDFAVVTRSGAVDRLDITNRDASWPGTATPGVTLRIRADQTPGINLSSFTQWTKDALGSCSERLPSTTIRAMIATEGSSQLPSVSTAITFANDDELRDALGGKVLAPFVDSEFLSPGTLSFDMVTEHRVSPNPNTWT